MLFVKIFYKILNIFIQFFIKSKISPVSNNLFLDANNRKKYIIYVFKYYSIIDILILRKQCLKNNFPDPLHQINIKNIKLPRCIFIKNDKKLNLFNKSQNYNFQDLLHISSILKKNKLFINIILVPINVLFGRNFDQEFSHQYLKNKLYKTFKKIILIIFYGRDTLIVFLKSLSLHYIELKHYQDEMFLEKLIRLICIKFIRIKFIIIGSKMLNRKKLFEKIVFSKSVREILSKKSNDLKKNYNLRFRMIKEISANYSHRAIYFSNKILKKVFKYAYQELSIHNINKITKLAKKGYIMIYIPCHRSHMDYLILSYILYNQGIAPPHIAAGINLNFWPIGAVLKLLGAFFIRRSFKGNKLYLATLQEYLKELFIQRNSIEYFIEGSRSRTGIFLYPKTGMLIMTIRAFLNNINRSIVLIPIYIGYENIIEIQSYKKEILGFKKEKENIYHIVKTIYKLKNLGKAYVNFANPILLHRWINKEISKTKNVQKFDKNLPLNEANKIIGNLAFDLMVRINNVAVVNLISILSSILVSTPNLSLKFSKILSQINFYFNIFKNIPYKFDIILPHLNFRETFNNIIFKKTFSIKKGKNKLEDVIFVKNHNIIKINYHSNTIKHLLILPSLVSNIIFTYKSINYIDLKNIVVMLYPFLKVELFLKFHENQISHISFAIIEILIQNNFIVKYNSKIYALKNELKNLDLIAFHSRGFLRKLMIICCILQKESSCSQTFLKNTSFNIMRKLLSNQTRFSDNFDKKNFFALVRILYKNFYIHRSCDTNDTKNKKMHFLIKTLMFLI